MTATFQVANFDNNIKEQTTLAQAIIAGATSLTLTNNQNLTTNDPLLIGSLGSETSEILTIASLTGATVVTTSATTLAHATNDTVTALVGDRIKLYRAPNVDGTIPADTSFSSVATFNLDPDQLTTTITDSGGSSAYWYKVTYLNSHTSIESPIGLAIADRPGAVHYTTLLEIRKRAGFEKNRNIGDDLINSFRATAEAQIDGVLNGVYIVPFSPPIDPLISEIAKSYAVGYLLNDQFRFSSTNGAGRGDEFIAWSDKQLQMIKNRQTTLVNADGTAVVSDPTNQLGFSGFPNTAAVTSIDTFGVPTLGEGFMFERKDIDGYTERRY